MGAILLGWVGVSHAAPRAELEVLGQLAVHTDPASEAPSGERTIRGRLSDELGKPVAGQVHVESAPGRLQLVIPCPGQEEETLVDEEGAAPTDTLSVGPSGEFCFLTEQAGSLSIVAQAEHYMTVRHDVRENATERISLPRFKKAPARIDLFRDEGQIVELLTSADDMAPLDARIGLTISCGEREMKIDQVPLAGNRLVRFEWGKLVGLSPGNCQFVAETTAQGHLPLRAKRHVLVRDRVVLELTDISTKKNRAYLEVTTSGQSGSTVPLSEGLVEAHWNGAFVALSPIENGRALLEIEQDSKEKELELVYVSASPSWVPGEPLRVTISSKAGGFRWAGVHTAGLLLFTFWLAYAWLKPAARRERPSQEPPPRKALVQESGKRSGPIGGQVRDAHTGAPLSEVKLVLQIVGAEETQELEVATSDTDGRFQFETRIEAHSLLRIIASGGEYMSLSSIPRAANVTVYLTERRRALVQNLVTWARALGPPWYGTRPPTPASVERTARREQRVPTQRWAAEVGEAAYAPQPPSEERVLDLEQPPDESTAPPQTGP